MRVFVPVPDDWDGSPTYRGQPLVAYRCGMTVWREPVPPDTTAPAPTGDDDLPPFSAAA